jgi:Lon protease-like protein
MPGRLPLFPLNLVLFPGEPLPLHIFEPRYRQMLADCLAGDQRFGITAEQQPRPGSLGCVALIRAAQQLEDGRSAIVVVGERRFGVRTLLDAGTPYLMAAVEPFEDAPGTAPLPAERAELRRLAVELRDAVSILADRPGEQPRWSEDDEQFSFEAAALIEASVEARADLLALRSTRERAAALLAILPGAVHQAKANASVHVRARSNGKGHPGHDIVAGT